MALLPYGKDIIVADYGAIKQMEDKPVYKHTSATARQLYTFLLHEEEGLDNLYIPGSIDIDDMELRSPYYYSLYGLGTIEEGGKSFPVIERFNKAVEKGDIDLDA